ncbi:MAG: HAD family hydrolase [Desulfomonilaceae bacterium]
MICLCVVQCYAQMDPLPSWNEGSAKQAIIHFVKITTDRSNKDYVPPNDRLATFDQDGTLWVEQPIYAQVMFAFNQVVECASKHPEWKEKMPFKAVLHDETTAMGKLNKKDLEEIVFATHVGMTTDEFKNTVRKWLAKAKDCRWKRPYTDLVYEPMLEVVRYFRNNGYKTYIVTGAGQDFVRAYSAEIYGMPPEQVIGSAVNTEFNHSQDGTGLLIRLPKLLLNDNFSGKPENIYLFTGRRPQAAFGNSTGDRQMLEYTQGGGKSALMMLVLHDDSKREYAYGPANGLPSTEVGTFTQELYDEAKSRGWHIISIKNDWKQLFQFK